MDCTAEFQFNHMNYASNTPAIRRVTRHAVTNFRA